MNQLEQIYERVNKEKIELDILLSKLIVFTDETGGVFDKLSNSHKRLLLQQRAAMTTYSDCLAKRLTLLSRDIANEYE